MYEMCLRDYRFIILDGVFLVHTPGVKHRKDKNKKIKANQVWTDLICTIIGQTFIKSCE